MKLIEVLRTAGTELGAVQFFEAKRWGASPRCAYCGSENLTARYKDLRHHCKDCSRSSSVTTGTNLQGSKIKLTQWLCLFSLMSYSIKKPSMLQVSKYIGVSYPALHAAYSKVQTLIIDNPRLHKNAEQLFNRMVTWAMMPKNNEEEIF